MKPSTPKRTQYPAGILIAYGPDNTRATKLVATIIKSANPQGENILHRWLISEGEIRNDPSIAAEIADFFKRHGVKGTTTYDRIIGCPHEEGIEYPMGRTCPRCPFWANIDRFTHEPIKPPVPTRTPEQILADLSVVRDSQPLEALESADAHRAALVEPLLQAIERGIANPSGLSEGEGMLFGYATYLLAKWREPRAYSHFIRWLSLPGEGAFDLGGDTVTEDGDRLLASVFDGDFEPIKSLILNRAEGFIENGFVSLKNLARVEAGPRGKWIEQQRERYPPIADVAEATGWWQCFQCDSGDKADRLAELAGKMTKPDPVKSATPYIAPPKTGRNDPCPCGSGKKYKKCCGA